MMAVYEDIGGADRWTWFILGYLFALGAVCPFVGSLSDLFGRRYVALLGASLLVIGNIVTSTAHTMNVFIAGMAILGAGAGLEELTALAVTSELAPTRKRGIYVSALIFTILPFCPSVLWGQLIASHSTWRYVGLFCGLWAFIGLVMTAIFYFPPPRTASVGLSRKEVIKRIDFVGGFLSISGLLLFMMGIQWGGYQYPWKSTHALVPLFIGVLLFVAFIVYEKKWARYPMFPSEIGREPRLLVLTLIITFISGANFFSVILFWPTQSYNVYGHDALQVGIRNLALGFPILAGACIVLVLLSWTRGHIRALMFVSCCFMTAGEYPELLISLFGLTLSGSGGLAALRLNNIWASYLLLVISGLGIGGIVVPASIITQIICPEELIATVTALTLAIRVLGGAIGYAIYYNVFSQHFKTNAVAYIGKAAFINGINSTAEITEIVTLTSAGLLPAIRQLPGVTDKAYNDLVLAGQQAYAESYPWVYYVSIAFGGVAIICSLFLGDIRKYMTDHVAVKYGKAAEHHHYSAGSLTEDEKVAV
jgi:MFS family permease